MTFLKPLAASRACETASGFRWIVFVLLSAMLLVAHGCHSGNVDHELCAPPSPQCSTP